MNFERLGLEEIMEIVELVKRFPMNIWLQKSASIQTTTSLLKFEDHRFCRSQFRSHAEPLLGGDQENWSGENANHRGGEEAELFPASFV